MLRRIQEENQKIFRLVATDGSRLSKADYVFDKEFDLPSGSNVLIPKKGLAEVAKFLDD